MEKIASGVFMWDGYERRSDRYGRFYMAASNFHNTISVPPKLEDFSSFVGKRVRLTAKVVEARKSGHLGDLAHGIFPSIPEVGEMIEIGIGKFSTDPYEGTFDMSLIPEDGRDIWWLDPHRLYRLHDQTVEIYAEETDDPATPINLPRATDELAYANTDDSFQVKTKKDSVKIHPRVESVDEIEGCFTVSFDRRPGDTFKIS